MDSNIFWSKNKLGLLIIWTVIARFQTKNRYFMSFESRFVVDVLFIRRKEEMEECRIYGSPERKKSDSILSISSFFLEKHKFGSMVRLLVGRSTSTHGRGLALVASTQGPFLACLLLEQAPLFYYRKIAQLSFFQ